MRTPVPAILAVDHGCAYGTDDHPDLLWLEVRAQRACLLSPIDKYTAQVQKAGALGVRAREPTAAASHQRAAGGCVIGERCGGCAQYVDQRRERLYGLVSDSLDQARIEDPEQLADERANQRTLAGKVPVHSAHADACPRCDFVHMQLTAAACGHPPRRLENQLAVAAGVDTHRWGNAQRRFELDGRETSTIHSTAPVAIVKPSASSTSTLTRTLRGSTWAVARHNRHTPPARRTSPSDRCSGVTAPEDLCPDHADQGHEHEVEHHRPRCGGADADGSTAGFVAVVAGDQHAHRRHAHPLDDAE